MTNHPLDDAAQFDHERAAGCIPSASSITREQIEQAAIIMAVAEFRRAAGLYKPFNSAHEGYAILLEEADELWDEIKKNDRTRSQAKMLDEAKQVAAMGLRFMADVCRQAITDRIVQDTIAARKETDEHIKTTIMPQARYKGPERRHTGSTRIITRNLSTIVVRNPAGLTTYHGPERRGEALLGVQALSAEVRKGQRRKGQRRKGGDRDISYDSKQQAIVRLKGQIIYHGPERRDPKGGRRQIGQHGMADRRKP